VNSPLDQLKFKHPWRPYQKRVLDELSSHLDDDHLHVVAAPGAGKTILGIEVMRCLGKPAVILAPTLTIRDQWVDRLVNLFMSEPEPEWISKSLRAPKFLTVVTYQALHASFTGEAEETLDEEEGLGKGTASSKPEGDALIDHLRRLGVDTLVLDEAHHLRKEWWKHLTTLKQGLEGLTVVALTATPPYDVDYREWQRYEALCGAIDAEISVPELVQCRNLCPHQDYVY
jgi:superfamily II DNA or RNA helicase